MNLVYNRRWATCSSRSHVVHMPHFLCNYWISLWMPFWEYKHTLNCILLEKDTPPPPKKRQWYFLCKSNVPHLPSIIIQVNLAHILFQNHHMYFWLWYQTVAHLFIYVFKNLYAFFHSAEDMSIFSVILGINYMLNRLKIILFIDCKIISRVTFISPYVAADKPKFIATRKRPWERITQFIIFIFLFL